MSQLVSTFESDIQPTFIIWAISSHSSPPQLRRAHRKLHLFKAKKEDVLLETREHVKGGHEGLKELPAHQEAAVGVALPYEADAKAIS